MYWTDYLILLLFRAFWVDAAAYWCEYPELFASIADGKTEEERSRTVLKWFIVSGLILRCDAEVNHAHVLFPSLLGFSRKSNC